MTRVDASVWNSGFDFACAGLKVPFCTSMIRSAARPLTIGRSRVRGFAMMLVLLHLFARNKPRVAPVLG